jgi:hypothetical protein
MVKTLKYDQLLALGYERATTRTAEGSRLDLSDFADYFEIDDKTSTPFNPAVRLNLETVDVPIVWRNRNAAEPGTEAHVRRVNNALAMNLANDFCREIRKVRFLKRRQEGWDPARTVVSEGDSWFQYPILLDDVIDVVSEGFNVFSLDAAGDKVAQIRRSGEFEHAITKYKPAWFLLSGGGNDIVGDGIKDKSLAHHLNPFTAGSTAAGLLKSSFDTVLMATVERDYTDILTRARRAGGPAMKILIHGYDYAVPGTGNDWMTRNLDARHVQPLQLRWDVVREIIDRFNAVMQRLAAAHPNVIYVNTRDSVAPAQCTLAVATPEWKDELHPRDPGFRRVAGRLLARM